MIKLHIVDKKTYHNACEEFEKVNDLAQRIKTIKTKDLKKEKYFVETSAEVTKFFNKNYIPDFFEIDIITGLIKLKILPNGVRRTLNIKKRQRDDNKTLKNTLTRIEEDLKKEFVKHDLDCCIKPVTYTKEMLQYLTIEFHDKNWKSEKPDDYCVIVFNKNDWTWDFVVIKSGKLRLIYETVKRIFEKRTSSTKNYRKNRHENNS